ncbi:hypothetical protein AMS68_007255 [Peltaster fructicola]|uniref:Zn(2)-C6 fungal-type domain-containing protein n=1 Tax=Peltaster fructicola TaxID=286661 RepID=A0A6H0Y4H1_9PEZI|nr:hypothetical protein AMS68_007255 [Peltaster fructicola]
MNSDIAQLASLAHSQIPLAQPSDYQDDGSNSNKRKADDGQQGQSKSRRSRYISLACNECKRRKIKCNGQSPCQRCGNLNLECIYAANCCNGFKDSQEYKDMSNHVASLQDQVNTLYDNLSSLRAQLGHSVPAPQAPMQQPQYSQSSSIDPSLQAQSYTQHPAAYQTDGQEQSRPKSQPQSQQSFRGLTSADFNFGVAKSSLQTMGINAQGVEEVDDGAAALTEEPGQAQVAQLYESMHGDKDPIWTITRQEALRLCQVYEEETSTLYPVVDVSKVTAYVNKLYQFLEAMHRTGLMQQGLPGPDAVDDEDTNILKLVLAIALTIENGGRSELGTRLFERVQPAIDNSLLGNVNIKGIRLLVMTAVYEFQRDNEGTSWRLIGLAARLCIELGLHRREKYDQMTDQAERSETILLFWSCYVLDRRWSLGTGMPFALQDADIDLALPRPGDLSPYLTAMIKFGEIGSKVWRAMAAAPSVENGGISPINIEEMDYLDYQVLQWHRLVPPQLQYQHPYQQDRTQAVSNSSSSRSELATQMIIYLRANQMRILIHRPILHSATTITAHREHAEKVIDIAKDSIRVLTYINQSTDMYRKKQVIFHAYLTSALAVLFLAVSHTPAFYAHSVRDEFYMAIDLVRGLSAGSFVSRRLWRTLKTLKEIAPKLGLPCKITQAIELNNATNSAGQRRSSKEEVDLSRSAAVAMAGLAGHNVDELAVFNQENQSYGSDAGSSHPDNMANDLTFMFEVAGGGYGEELDQGTLPSATRLALASTASEAQSADTIGMVVGDDDLSNVLKDLF